VDETARMVVTVLGTGGGTTLLIAFAKGFGKWRSGEAHREQVRNTSAEALRVKAIADREKSDKERDRADDLRREAEEHVAMLQRQIILLGATPVKRETEQSK